ncbi:13967_t:CDS:1, partial [Funneliformis caledonium]
RVLTTLMRCFFEEIVKTLIKVTSFREIDDYRSIVENNLLGLSSCTFEMIIMRL